MTQNRTREEQIENLACILHGQDMTVNRTTATRYISEAEARGRAELQAENARLREGLEKAANDISKSKSRPVNGVSGLTIEATMLNTVYYVPGAVLSDIYDVLDATTQTPAGRLEAFDMQMSDPVAWRWTYEMARGRDAIWHFGPDWPTIRNHEGAAPCNIEPLYRAPSCRPVQSRRVAAIDAAMDQEGKDRE